VVDIEVGGEVTEVGVLITTLQVLLSTTSLTRGRVSKFLA